MSIKVGEVYGEIAGRMLQSHTIEDEMYWKLRVAQLAISSRCNIPCDNGIELYLYDHLLPGMHSWKEYFIFITKMIRETHVPTYPLP